MPIWLAPAIIVAGLVSQKQHGQRDGVHLAPIGAGEQYCSFLACLGTISGVSSVRATAVRDLLLRLFLARRAERASALEEFYRRPQLFFRQLHLPTRTRTSWHDEAEVLHAVHRALVRRREWRGAEHVRGSRIVLGQDGDAVRESVAGPLAPLARGLR